MVYARNISFFHINVRVSPLFIQLWTYSLTFAIFLCAARFQCWPTGLFQHRSSSLVVQSTYDVLRMVWYWIKLLLLPSKSRMTWPANLYFFLGIYFSFLQIHMFIFLPVSRIPNIDIYIALSLSVSLLPNPCFSLWVSRINIRLYVLEEYMA